METFPTSLSSQHLLYKFMLSQICKGVPMVPKDIPCEELDAVSVTDLVNFNDDIPGAASQAHLQKDRNWLVRAENCDSLPYCLHKP